MSVPDLPQNPSPRAWRRMIVVLTLALAAAIVVVIVLATNKSNGSSGSGAGTSAWTASGATTVQRRNLVETDTESGTLGYAGTQTVYNRLSGTITWLPAVGQLIRPGYVLYRIDNQPVLLLNGATPAYRNLDSSDTAGPDILELNAELVELGYDPDGIVVDDEWQAATTAGVDALQAAWGETETGELTLGQVVFLPGPQLVSAVDGTVGSTGGGAASLVDPAPRPEFVSLTDTTSGAYDIPGATTDTDTTTTGANTNPKGSIKPKSSTNPRGSTNPNSSTSPSGSTTPGRTSTTTTPSGGTTESEQLQMQALLQLLKTETEQLQNEHSSTTPGSSTTPKSGSTKPKKSSTTPSSPTKPGSSGSNGSGAGGTAILQTTSDQLVVTVDLPATSQSEATVGEVVTVELPAGNSVNGRITSVSSVAVSPSSSGDQGNGSGGNGSSSETVPVTIALTQHVGGAGLDQAAVSVEFAEAKATNVLSVPVTSLLATGGDSYAVQAAAPPHRLIPVTTGLFAAGYVEISGSGIYPGLAVTDSQG